MSLRSVYRLVEAKGYITNVNELSQDEADKKYATLPGGGAGNTMWDKPSDGARVKGRYFEATEIYDAPKKPRLYYVTDSSDSFRPVEVYVWDRKVGIWTSSHLKSEEFGVAASTQTKISRFKRI